MPVADNAEATGGVSRSNEATLARGACSFAYFSCTSKTNPQDADLRGSPNGVKHRDVLYKSETPAGARTGNGGSRDMLGFVPQPNLRT